MYCTYIPKHHKTQQFELFLSLLHRIEAGKQTPGVIDIRKKAFMSGGSERLSGPDSKLSSSAIVQKRALTMPKPEWHAPWKLMRVSTLPEQHFILTILFEHMV